MGKRYLTREEIFIIRESLLVNKRETRTAANIEFTDKLDKYQRVSDILYDEYTNTLKTIDTLYKDLTTDSKIIVILEDVEEKTNEYD